MSATKESSGTRTIEATFDIDAPIEAVWKALTDADELTRWFPLQARVKPGAGGSVWMSWNGKCESEMPIEIWEPNKHLRVHWHDEPYDPDGVIGPAVDGPPRLAVDYHLEGKGGKTLLRLIHAGFGPDSDWDHQYDGTRRGWQFELRGLKHYLENHCGTERHVAHATVDVDCSLEEAWRRLLSENGLVAAGVLHGVPAGETYRIRLACGDEFHGDVQINSPPKDLALVVKNMNTALFRLHIDRSYERSHTENFANMWLSTYGLPKSEVNAIQTRYRNLLEKLF